MTLTELSKAVSEEVDRYRSDNNIAYLDTNRVNMMVGRIMKLSRGTLNPRFVAIMISHCATEG